MKQFVLALGAVVVAVLVMTFALNSQFSARQAELAPGGTTLTLFDIDRQGTFANRGSEGYYTHTPCIIRLDANPGDRGHVSYGMINMVNKMTDTDYGKVGVTVKLLKAEVTKDLGLIRIGLATAWIDKVTIFDGHLKHWYLEFDIWNSPEMSKALVVSTIYWVEGGETTGMPTVLVKSYQLKVGEETSLMIEIQKGFDKAYPGLDLFLDDVYFVVEKSDPNSEFNVELLINELRLYR